MANTLPDYIINTLLIGAFMIGIITFGVMLSLNNGMSANDVTGNTIDLNSMEKNINTTRTQATAWQTALEKDDPAVYVGYLFIRSLFSTGLSILGLVLGMVKAYLLSLTIIGVPEIFSGIITTSLTIGLIYMVYRFIRGT